MTLSRQWVCRTPPALFVCGCLTWTLACAEVGLRSETELLALLKKQPPCCVIDARSAAAQRQHPVPDALHYRADLRIVPTASVVVLADTDPLALQVVRALSQRHPGKDVYGVKGGAAVWSSLLKSLDKVTASQAPGAPAAMSFVIPHNTCETGAPLQVLSSGKPKP